MAGEALNRAGEHIDSFKLVPSDHGKFHITIDGELVAWHRHEPDAHIFPRPAGHDEGDRRAHTGLRPYQRAACLGATVR